MRITCARALVAASVSLTLLTVTPTRSTAGYVAQAITLPGYRFSTALDMNAAGQVIGYVSDPTGRNPTHAFLFDPTKGTTDIGALFDRNTSSKPEGFNEAGQVFGQLTGGKNDGETFFASPTAAAPETGTLTLAGIGFLGLLGLGRRFRKQAA